MLRSSAAGLASGSASFLIRPELPSSELNFDFPRPVVAEARSTLAGQGPELFAKNSQQQGDNKSQWRMQRSLVDERNQRNFVKVEDSRQDLKLDVISQCRLPASSTLSPQTRRDWQYAASQDRIEGSNLSYKNQRELS